MSSKYRHLYQFCYVKIFSTNHNGNLLLLDDPGRVRSQITNVEGQIQRFDFECNLVVMRKVIMGIPPALRSKPVYYKATAAVATAAESSDCQMLLFFGLGLEAA